MNNPLIALNHIRFSIGDQEILHDVSFDLFSGETVALVGANGVGKSTLLKIVAGVITEHGGTIEKTKNTKITYVPQEIIASDAGKTAREYLDVNVKEVELLNIGLSNSIMERKISELSGGEKSKVNLLRMLKNKSNLYLLDEPTNNLDQDTLTILRSFIIENAGKCSFIIVSHDRQFLEDVTYKTLEIGSYNKTVSAYPVRFSEYLNLRKKKIENEWKVYNDYLTKKRALERSLTEKKQWSHKAENNPQTSDNDKMAKGTFKDWSGKVLGKAVKTAKSKLENLEKVDKPKEMMMLSYDIQVRERSGDAVFFAENISKKFGERIIGPFNLDVRFGDRLVITGNNGIGKTTLLKLLLGKINPDTGLIKRGTRVQIEYLPQESEISDKFILEEVKKLDPDSETEFRKILNNFGLSSIDLMKGTNALSPGERSRYALALLIARMPNCILLDEPTNHLDIFALDFLERAISSYKGTLIIVTHDKYFQNRIGHHQVMDIGNQKLPK